MKASRIVRGNIAAAISLSMFSILLSSCASFTFSKDEPVGERIRAENRIMRQNLNLAMRENSILKEENIQIRSESSLLRSRVRLLESEIESLNKKHSEDINLLNEKYQNLSRQKDIADRESALKLQEMNTANKALEEKLSAEIKRLSEENRTREEQFNKERLAMETAFAGKELQYRQEQADLKKNLLDVTTELESIKSRLTESEAQLKNANKENAEKDKTINSLKVEKSVPSGQDIKTNP